VACATLLPSYHVLYATVYAYSWPIINAQTGAGFECYFKAEPESENECDDGFTVYILRGLVSSPKSLD
jgi:hypothetical protein